MKFLAKFKITGMDNIGEANIKGTTVPVCDIICSCSADDCFCASVFGSEKIQYCKEKMNAGVVVEGIFNMVGKVEKGQKFLFYNNYVTLKWILSSEKIAES